MGWAPVQFEGLLLSFCYIRRLGTLLTIDNLKFNRVTFLQALVAVRNQSTVVDEDVWSVIASNEPKALGIVEPLYGSFQFHVPILPGGGPTHRCRRSR